MTPDKHTNKEFFIDVDGGHQLYVQDWGSPKGLPVIFLHGGPGDRVKDSNKQRFDPSKHHVIFFDQRGCGQSLPYGSLKSNTTDDLIEDITKIAGQVKFRQFVLCGGSWGSCLALAYALKYPKRVRALLIDGVFTGSQKEIGYLSKGEFAKFFPEVWQQYLSTVPAAHKKSPSKYHSERILGEDQKAVRESSAVYQNLLRALLALDDRFTPVSAEDPAYDPNGIRMEVHYMANRCFMPDNYILDNAQKLAIPVWIVQGRYDMVCPPSTAYELDKKLPNSHLIMVTSNHKGEHETHSVMRTILIQLAEKG